MADIDPLRHTNQANVEELDPAFYGLTVADHEKVFHIGESFFGKKELRLGELLTDLKHTYCSAIGPEVMHLTDPKEKQWLLERLESARGQFAFQASKKSTCLSG